MEGAVSPAAADPCESAASAVRAAGKGADWNCCACARDGFIALVRDEGARHYRDLPWRHCRDPYAVLVSEVMLQQTQVSRVLRYWERWLRQFPTLDALAAADTAAVLEAWQGLGYNRRALALKRAAEECAARGCGLPGDAAQLQQLPGIGPATAAGVAAFAFDRPAVYLETNVRSVFLHCLFPDDEAVPDRRLIPYVADTCPSGASTDAEGGPRDWYYCLLDYGAHLKSQGINPSRRSRHYARQSAFEGSHREKRSLLLKAVLAAPEGIAAQEAFEALNDYEREAGRDGLDADALEALAAELQAEGFFRREGDLLVP